MSQGRLAAAGDFHELRALMDDRPMRVRVRTDRPRELAGRCSKPAPRSASGSTARARSSSTRGTPRAVAHALAPVARDREARLFEVRPLDADLEGVFRYVVQR